MMDRVANRHDGAMRRGALVALGSGWLLLSFAGLVVAADHAVAISGFSYSPATITVAAGGSVTWTNSDAQAHTATANDGSFDTDAIGNGASQTVTFSTSGTFAYHCEFHADMAGTVIVGDGLPPTDAMVTADTPGKPGHEPGQLVAVLALVFLVMLGVGFNRFRAA
jgi:plastocyanin